MSDIYFKDNGRLFISSRLNSDWVIKIPTVQNRLLKNGSIALKMTEQYDLKSKKGILWIDMTDNVYIFIPKEVVEKHYVRETGVSGAKKGLKIFSVHSMVKNNEVYIVDIPLKKEEPARTGLANDIRKRFGI